MSDQQQMLFKPVQRVMQFPLGSEGHLHSQIDFYDAITNPNCDLRDIAVVVEPLILAAQIEPTELCSIINNTDISSI
jgi:hypothetical protein